MRFNNIAPFPLVFIFLLVPWLVRQGDVNIEQDLPDRLAPGGSKEVTLRVKKGDRGGFAKLELQIPDGIEVQAVEKSGASFTFEDGVAKFIWMAMPKGGEFVVKYRLKAKPEASGKRTINGDFRYIEENERKRVHIKEKTLRIGKGGEKKKDQEEEKPSARDTGKGIKVIRNIKKTDERRFRVRLNVRNIKTKGFAKMIDRVPKGFEAVKDETMGASFTFQDRKVKFVWMQLPRTKGFWVQYILKAKSAEPNTYSIEGTFSFLRDGKSIEKKIATSPFEVTEPLQKATAADTAASPSDEGKSTDKVASDTNRTASTDQGEQAEKEEEKSTASSKTKEEEGKADSLTGDVPAPQKGIDYRVQICAGHDPVKEDHFSRVYGYKGDYDIDHHKGWIKYLTGKFDQYKKARDKRVYFRQNFDLPGPFVTAYNDGERITVQEALMVTDQEWVQ